MMTPLFTMSGNQRIKQFKRKEALRKLERKLEYVSDSLNGIDNSFQLAHARLRRYSPEVPLCYCLICQRWLYEKAMRSHLLKRQSRQVRRDIVTVRNFYKLSCTFRETKDKIESLKKVTPKSRDDAYSDDRIV